MFDDPALPDETPGGATVICVPADDEDEAAAHLAAASRMWAAGKTAHVVHV